MISFQAFKNYVRYFFIVIGLIFVSVSLVSASLTDDLEHYWRLNTTTDDVGSFDLTNTGMTTSVAGKIGLAYSGADGGDYLSYTTFDPTIYTSWSMAMWWKPLTTYSGATTGKYYWHLGDLETSRLSTTQDGLADTTAHALYTRFGSTNWATLTDSASTTTTWTSGNWYYIVQTYDDITETYKIYVNGNLEKTEVNGLTSMDNFIDNSVILVFNTYGVAPNSVNGFNAVFDEIGFWSRFLTADEVTSLYNSGDGLDLADFTPPVYTPTYNTSISYAEIDPELENTTTQLNLSIEWIGHNVTASSTKINYNNNDYPASLLSSTYGVNGTLKYGLNLTTPLVLNNNTQINFTWNYNLTMNASDKHAFSGSSSQNVLFNYPRLTINLADEYDASAITGFNVTINGITNSTATSSLTILMASLGSYASTIKTDNYFTANYNITVDKIVTAHTSNLTQAYLNITAYDRVTNAQILNFTINDSVTTGTTTNGLLSLSMKAGNYTLSFYNILGYYNNTFEVEILPLITKLSNVTNVHNTKLTIYAKDYFTNASIDNFAITINTSTFTETLSTLGSNITFNVSKPINYTVYMNISNYANQYSQVNLTIIEENFSFYLFKENSVYIRIYDELTNNLITDRNVSVEFIGDSLTADNETDTGALVVEGLIADDYRIRYSANQYPERIYYVTITNGTTQTVDVYLLNQSYASNVTVNLLDEKGDAVEGAFIKQLRYYIGCNCYKTIEIGQTNFEGKAFISTELNKEFHKYIVEYKDKQYLETAPFIINSVILTLRITISNIDPTNNLRRIGDIIYNLSYNNASTSFRFTFSETNNLAIGGCLRLYTVKASGDTLTNESCIFTTGGTIILKPTPTNGTTYKAVAKVNFTGEEVHLITIYHTFGQSKANTGIMGVILTIFLVITFAFIFINNPNLAIIGSIVILIFTRVLGILNIGITPLIGLVGIGIVILFINKS